MVKNGAIVVPSGEPGVTHKMRDESQKCKCVDTLSAPVRAFNDPAADTERRNAGPADRRLRVTCPRPVDVRNGPSLLSRFTVPRGGNAVGLTVRTAGRSPVW